MMKQNMLQIYYTSACMEKNTAAVLESSHLPALISERFLS